MTSVSFIYFSYSIKRLRLDKGVTDAASCSYETVVTLPLAVCGDNRVTGTEQCDPPGVGCCDASCNFISASAQHVCRESVSQCDVAEYCRGNNASCPGIYHKMTNI